MSSKVESGVYVPLSSAAAAVRTLKVEPGVYRPSVARLTSGAAGELKWGDWRLVWRLDSAPAHQRRDGMSAWFIPGAYEVRGWRAGDRAGDRRAR